MKINLSEVLKKPKHPIYEIRTSHNLTTGDMAALLDVSANFIIQVENGFARLPDKLLYDICVQFELSARRLIQEIREYKKMYREHVLRML